MSDGFLYVVHASSVTKIDLQTFTEVAFVDLSTIVGEDNSYSSQLQFITVAGGQPYIKRVGGIPHMKFNQGVF